MQIREIAPNEVEVVQALLLTGGWDQRAADLMRLDELIARSQVTLVAVVEDEVVGFLRGLTDGISNGYISMLVVDPKHQKQGIGSALVRACMGNNQDMTWVLRAGRPGLLSFYEKLGFNVSTVALERPRRPTRGA